MKKLTIKWLLLSMILSIASINTAWATATQRYIYVGISDNCDNNKGTGWGFNFWGGTNEGVIDGATKSTYIANTSDSYRTYHVYRILVYDDHKHTNWKGNGSGWWVPSGGLDITLDGDDNNAIFYVDESGTNPWVGAFQTNYQVSSTASLSASTNSIAIGTNLTLTPSLSTNATYNEIKSTSYSVTTNPNSGGSVTSAGVFSATKAGSYTVTATVTYNAKDFSNITSTTTATYVIYVYATITFDMEGGSSGTSSQNATYGSATSSITAPSLTGHDFGGYWTGDDGTGTQVIDENGAWKRNIANFTNNDDTWKWIVLTNQTLHAKWTAQEYDIIYKDGGNKDFSGEHDDSESTHPTTHTYGTGTDLNSATKTGYTFGGWFTTSACTGVAVTSLGATAYTDDITLYAKWTAKTTTITYSQSGDGYSTGGPSSTETATYDDDMPAISVPTATNDYAFMGYYDDEDGEGTQYYTSTGASARNWDKEDASATLYAYFKQAEITAITFTDGAVVAPSTSKTVTATIEPTPAGDVTVCWRVLYSNDNAMDPQPDFSPATALGNSVSFTSPEASGIYKMEAVLHSGENDCSGSDLSSYVATFQVASDHDVTVQYKDANGNVIAASTTVTGKPLSWSEDDIEAPDIFGYTFDHWDAGDGVTIKDESGEDLTTSTYSTIQIKATYDGRLTAVYNQKQMIYFKNTLGWSDVYVNFYTGSYWNSTRGSGNHNVTNRNKHMTRIGTTDVWYFDYGYNEGGSSITPSLFVSFTEEAQNGTGDGAGDFWKADPGVNVVYPANYSDDIDTDKSKENGFKAATPMFVPRPLGEGEAPVKKNEASSGWANYYNDGYWTQYTPGTGYTLEIYNSSGDYLKSATFVSDDDLMPMKAVVDLEAGQTYQFQLRRGGTSSAGIYYGNSGEMTYKNHGQSQPWEMINSMEPFKMARITTNAAGDYTFNLSYSAYHNPDTEKDEYRLRIAAEYPVAAGDYRIYYTDAAKWSQTSAHTSGWCHPSSVVAKNTSTTEGKTDVVSLYVAYGSSPSAKFQKSEIDGETSAVSWSDVASGTVSLTGITKAGVYNFYLSQPENGTSIQVDSIRPYNGNYYIRTDCAGGGKWDNFRGDINHMMTYSDYASAQSKLVTDTGYTHYYAHWVETGTNVKFCIANEYSQCISDTLTEDLGYVVASITAAGNTNAGRLNSANANIRFMWNERTNRIKRSYLGGSANIADRFLVLEGDSKLFDENGNALTGENRDHNKEGNVFLDQDNQVVLHDDGNFIYERTIQVQTGAEAKLTAKYNEKVQYFIGTSSSTVTLLGGDASDTKYTMRVLYDFKTNRLVTAYIPRGNIDQDLKINADIMFLREHQGDIEGITFSTGKSISEIKNVYFALQFNKYTLNNKDKSTYEPLDPLLSRYERDLFYVSFPYDVKVSDIIGFGTYGQHWIIEYYDGAARAREGYWADSESFWKFVTPAMKSTYVLKAGTGYIVALDLDELGESSDIWTNTDQVELLFPGNVTSISSTSVTYAMPEHECTINRPTPKGNRTIADSHWNVMGVPTYHNVTASFANQTDANSYVWASSNAPRYLYTWNMADNSLSSTSSTGYNYHSMHAYVVQYYGDVTFTTSTSPAPTPIAARMTDTPDREYKLELISEEQVEDQTFVRMTDNEGVTYGFEFGDDLSKEMNRNRGNIWTVTTDSVEVAGNSQPHPLTTTIVPVGVKIAANGEYTFSMPEGTNGGDVWLIDNANSSRTNLGLMDYTVNLTAGTYEGRFSLEFPVQNVVTEIENAANANANANADAVRKVFVGGQLYIIRDGVIYNASGARVY